MHPKQTGAPESDLCWSKVCSVMVRKVFSSEIFDPPAEIVLNSVGIYFTIHIFNDSRRTPGSAARHRCGLLHNLTERCY